MHEQHRGAFPNSPFKAQDNTRGLQLDLALNAVETTTTNAFKNASDPQGVLQLLLTAPGKTALTTGTVIHALPHLGWYRVQMADVQGILRCCSLTTTGHMPFGVRDATVIPPGSTVLVFIPRGSTFGYIVGSVPNVTAFNGTANISAGLHNPDFVLQGGMTGLLQEVVHYYPLQNMSNGGNALNFAANRPRDLTAQEKTFSTTTGLLFSLDDYLFQLRVNEMCGVWGSLIDGFLRIAGQQLLVESPVYELDSGNDEGEARHFEGTATYPWEALGLSEPGTPIGQSYGSNADPAVAFKTQEDPATGKWPYASYDIGTEPPLPFYRYREHGGYLGQGHVREVVVPTHEGNKTAQSPPAEGVFSEWIGLDGSFHLMSAKSVLIGRRVNMPVAERVKPAEDGTGDDSREDNYKFSGYFGAGEEHKVGDVRVPDDNASIRRVMGVDDLIAYAVNWKRVHPFHYHKNDYSVREENDGFKFTAAQEFLDFTQLSNQNTMASVFPKAMRIDHRYNDVAYYQTTSFLYFLEDGGVMLADGFGSAIKMTAGKIRLECAGDIELAPGRSLIGLGSQVILRAKKSVDISASDNDIRIKAERNLHMAAGNGGSGGMLLECKGIGTAQDFENRIGEEVTSSGIILKATDSVVAAYGGDVYLRSGESKTIDLDADKGRALINLYGDRVNTFSANGMYLFIGPSNEDSTIRKLFSFTNTVAIMPVDVLVGGNVALYENDKSVIASGNVFAKGSIACERSMAQGSKGGMVGEVGDEFKTQLNDSIDNTATAVSDILKEIQDIHKQIIVDRYYQDSQLGSDTNIVNMQFSYRDTDDQTQYRTANLLWDQRRWEQFVTLGLAAGGTEWTENPVMYQGKELYPWPGRKAWKEDTAFLQATDAGLIEPFTGNAKNRASGIYDNPELGNVEAVTMASGYRSIE